MLSLLRRVSIPIISSSSSSCKVLMDSNNSFGGSSKLVALARQLRLYKPPPTFDESEIEELRMEESAGKVVSQVGFAESATPVANQPERFRPKRAAVLICLFEGNDGNLRVILTKRSSKLSTHSGEVSLPGGKADEGDTDDADTATREAKEEIGLDPSVVNVVTALEPFLSKHLLRVIPVIGILSDKNAFKPAPNADEVESVFDAPLEMFLKDENRRSEEREWMGDKYLIHFFDYETDGKKYVIWGLTAGILIRAASVVYQRPTPFVEQNPKFKVPRDRVKQLIALLPSGALSKHGKLVRQVLSAPLMAFSPYKHYRGTDVLFDLNCNVIVNLVLEVLQPRNCVNYCQGSLLTE